MSIKIPELPFEILALGPFGASNQPGKSQDRSPAVTVENGDFDTAMSQSDISLYVSLPQHVCPEGGVDISIRRMKDLHPDQLINSIPYLKTLQQAGDYIADAKKQGRTNAEIHQHLQSWTALPQLTPEPEKAKSSAPASDAVDSILSMVDLPDAAQPEAAPRRTLAAQIDMLLEKSLAHILADTEFNKIEAAWRGAGLFWRQARNTAVRLHVAPATPETVTDVLEQLSSRLIADPPGLIIIDFPFDNTAPSIERLQAIAAFAETHMVPVACWAAPGFLNIKTWEAVDGLPFLPHHLDTQPFAKWRKLQDMSCGRWLALTCNRVPARYPYGKDNPLRSLSITENSFCWTSPVWLIAALASRSIDQNGWPTRITGMQQAAIADLPLTKTDTRAPITTEIAFSRDRLDQFIRAGLMPVAPVQGRDSAFFPAETTVAGISFSAQLLYALVARFLFWCLDHFDKNAPSAEIEAHFTRAFTLFFEQTGSFSPEKLQITAAAPNSEGRVPLHIALTPPPAIHPSREEIVLDLNW